MSGLPSEPSAQASSSEGSWAETFAPKLSSSTISSLKQTYLANYPSEVLTPEVFPSTRLLSLVHHNCKWIPWKFRITQSRAEDMVIQKPAKSAKIEGLSLHSLLLDDPPSMDINNQSMGLHGVRSLMAVHDTAVALCGAAHLVRLKAYSLRFMSFLSQRFDQESGLRPPNILEAQSADRHIWQGISQLIQEKGWTLNDALEEFTVARADLPGLLQPRPRAQRPQAPPSQSGSFSTKGKGSSGSYSRGLKGIGKDGKSSQKGPRWVTELFVKGEKKQLCLAFQSNRCTRSECRFTHKCAFPKPDGSPCGGDHSARDHGSTPH